MTKAKAGPISADLLSKPQIAAEKGFVRATRPSAYRADLVLQLESAFA